MKLGYFLRYLFLPVAFLLWGWGNVFAQYDITDYYLQDAEFDDHFDYTKDDAGNVFQEICDIAGWHKDINVDYTIAGIYQFGTSKTFNGAEVPSVGFRGDTIGGCLALSTGWLQSLKYYQQLTLPAGTYSIVTAFYNCSLQTAGKSLVGWVPNQGDVVMSNLSSFPSGEWLLDTITFTLNETHKGKIQVGYKSTMNSNSGSQAKVVLDFVQLLRNTPIGDSDVVLLKDSLETLLVKASELYGGGKGVNAADLLEAIDSSKCVVADEYASMEKVMYMMRFLAKAIESYCWSNPTGNIPIVTTDPRYARGGTMAFGRMQVQGDDILEQGFCWSTLPHPTIWDNRTSKYLEHNGFIYWLKGLNPATQYYMRAYAITKGYQVGYGNVLRFYTLPAGNITYSIRSDGDDDARKRITNSMKQGVGLWNDLTAIKGVNFNVGINTETPTADCSYGGYIRVGTNTSYQKTGTMLHEMLHGVGVGTHDPFWSPQLRSEGTKGYWLGDRVTNVLRFLDNSETERLNGDTQHIWPYGINGANEDDGTDLLYIGNSLICEALGEDGLPPSGGFATPAYVLEQEDTIKYYLKSESKDFGLYTSYLVQQADGSIAGKEIDNSSVLLNDSAAWYISFIPTKSYYVFKNVATGRYLTYRSSVAKFTTREVQTPSNNDYFHLIRARISALDSTDFRGYYLIHPMAYLYPNCIAAKDSGVVVTSPYDLGDGATQQRWVILSEKELEEFSNAEKLSLLSDLNIWVNRMRILLDIPHVENSGGIDAAFEGQVEDIEAACSSSETINQLLKLRGECRQFTFNFLKNVTPKDENQPFDLSFLITNADMSTSQGWSETPSFNYSCAEFYQTTFDFYQVLSVLPQGTYKICVQAFQRPGTSSDTYTSYLSNQEKVSTFLYVNQDSVKVKDIWYGAQDQSLGIGTEVEVSGKYIPNDMQSAANYFNKGLYDNSLVTMLADDGTLRMGLRCSYQASSYWTIFDNFRLYYYGQLGKEIVGIGKVTDSTPSTSDIYDVYGRKMSVDGKDQKPLSPGIYIKKGKKFILR